MAEDDDDLATQRVKRHLGERQPDGAGSSVPYLIVLSGAGVGETYRLDRSETIIGRDDQAHIRVVDEGVSRQHARLLQQSGTVLIEDLQSTNGTLLNQEPIKALLELADGDKISVGSTTILKFSYHDNFDQAFQADLFSRARRDALTNAFKRKYFDERLQIEFSYARRHKRALAVIFLDIDHFKTINDTHGHPGGDQVLIEFCDRIARTLRAEDLLARYGGEEFVMLARGSSDEEARQFAERLRNLVRSAPFQIGTLSVPITVSVGVAAFPASDITTTAELVGAADRALYVAKATGRDQVVVHNAPATRG